MRILLVFLCVTSVSGGRYAFFRSLKGNARRMFGGVDARAGTWPGACALLTRAMIPACSCAVITPRWALTAAHCAKPQVGYVQYNGLEQAESDVAKVAMMYAHPEYQVVQQSDALGSDIVLLHHDIGLARTSSNMWLREESYSKISAPALRDPVATMLLYDINELLGREIEVLGFGKTEEKPVGERLRKVRLLLMNCSREGWQYCACAMGVARGVCSGDSGGPVLYNGTQIGVTSLGPIECGRLAGPPPPLYYSVFTVLQPYADMINDTLHDMPNVLRMREVPAAAVRDCATLELVLGLVVSGWGVGTRACHA